MITDNEGSSLNQDGVEHGFDLNNLAWDDDVFCGMFRKLFLVLKWVV